MTEKAAPAKPFTWTLRTIQLLGALLALSGLGSGVGLFRMLQPEMASYSASALGLGLGFLGIVLPQLGLSALLLLPSTALLCLPAMRLRFRVLRVWFALWCLNLGLSAAFLCVTGLFLWALLTAPKVAV